LGQDAPKTEKERDIHVRQIEIRKSIGQQVLPPKTPGSRNKPAEVKRKKKKSKNDWKKNERE